MDIDQANRRWRTALADGDLHGVERLLRHDDRLTPWGHRWPGTLEAAEAAELRGLVLLGGTGDVPFAADAPWDVPAGADLVGALERVWAPVARHCPDFLAALRAEVLGLALVAMDGGYLLGYPHLADRERELPSDLKDLAPYTGVNSLDVLWGTAPTRLGPADVVSLLDEPLPAGVRDLAAVHALACRSWRTGTAPTTRSSTARTAS
jgi:hypothetical protein